MSRLLPISPKKMEKILFKLGFEKLRQRGAHAFYRHPDGRTTTLTFHAGEDIGRGLLRKIINDIEISREEFERLR